MLEGIISIAGLCIVFIPIIIYINYLFKHIKGNTNFDNHLSIIEDKKGKKAVYLAYFNRIILFICTISFGVMLSNNFKEHISIELFITTLIIYFITKYFDEKNEK